LREACFRGRSCLFVNVMGKFPQTDRFTNAGRQDLLPRGVGCGPSCAQSNLERGDLACILFCWR
jgi:hypothetical protein